MSNPIALGIMVSGNGSNLQAFIDAIKSDNLMAEIKIVISDHPQAYALKRARSAGIMAVTMERQSYESREKFELAMVKQLQDAGVELVLLAGYMRLLSASFLSHFPQRVMNIHPSLLPAFPGLDAQQQALDYGAKLTGCTVHFVDEGMDTGPIILQTAVPIFSDDSKEDLARRIQREEHRVYPEAVRLYQRGRLELVGRKVMILAEED